MELIVTLDDAFALVWQLLRPSAEKYRGKPQITSAAVDIVRNRLSVQKRGVRHEQNKTGLQNLVPFLLLATVAHDLRQRVKHVAPLFLIGRHVADFFVAGPDVGKPQGKVPRAPVNVAVFIVNHSNLDIRIAVGRGNLRNHALGNGNRRLAVLPARYADQTMFQQVYRYRHVFEHTEIVPNDLRLIRQGIVNQRKSLFGNVDFRLKGNVAHAEANAEKVVVGHIAVPQERRAFIHRATRFRAEITLFHSFRVFIVRHLDTVAHFDEVFAVTLKASVLRLAPHFHGMP